MANINQITVDNNTYDIEDATARAGLDNKLPLSGGTMTGNIAMGGNKVTGLPTPTDTSDAVPFGDATWELYSVDTLTEEVSIFKKSWTDTDVKQVFVSADIKTGGTTTANKNTNLFFRESGYQVLLVSLLTRSNSNIYFSGTLFCLPGRGIGGIGGLGYGSYYQPTFCSAGYQNSEQGGQHINGVTLMLAHSETQETTITMGVGTQIKIWRKRI